MYTLFLCALLFGATGWAQEQCEDTETMASELPKTHSAFYYTEAVQIGSAPSFSTTAPFPLKEEEKSPPKGFALIKVKAASLNPVDKYIAAGMMAGMSPLFGLDRSMGSDLAGEVVAVGEGATVETAQGPRAAKVGDVVFADGIQGSGTFAQYALVMSSQLALKPEKLSFAQAAAVPLAGITALQAFTMHLPQDAQIGPGSKVLVLGGSGGVGSLAVQIAKALGATVAATSSNTQFLKDLGADIAIDYHSEDWGEKLKGEDYDLIFSTVNDAKPIPAHQRAAGVLGPKGHFLVLLRQSLPDPVPEDGRTYKVFMTDSTKASDLQRLAGWAEEGKVKAVLHEGKTFEFNAKGMEDLLTVSNSGRAKGKLVMEIA
jgi:NADPH:quinone reductase-like Zn-dependent oxidoreductase